MRAELLLGLRSRHLLGVEHLHAPAVVEALRGREADAAHADDAERPAGEVLAEPAERLPRLPPPLLRIGGALHDPPRRGEHERHGDVGGGVGEHAGRVADADAARGAGGHVDVVEPDREVADHLQLRRGVEQRAVDAVGEQRHQAVAVLHPVAQDLVAGRQLIGPQVDVAGGADRVQPLVGDAAGDEDLRACHGSIALRAKGLEIVSRSKQGCQGCQHCQGCQDCQGCQTGVGGVSGNVGSLGSLAPVMSGFPSIWRCDGFAPSAELAQTR